MGPHHHHHHHPCVFLVKNKTRRTKMSTLPDKGQQQSGMRALTGPLKINKSLLIIFTHFKNKKTNKKVPYLFPTLC
jgi:hypothetical protein